MNYGDCEGTEQLRIMKPHKELYVWSMILYVVFCITFHSMSIIGTEQVRLMLK